MTVIWAAGQLTSQRDERRNAGVSYPDDHRLQGFGRRQIERQKSHAVSILLSRFGSQRQTRPSLTPKGPIVRQAALPKI